MHFGEREGRASGSSFRKVVLILFFNIVLTWKIVGVSEVLVLYKYIDVGLFVLGGNVFVKS